MTVYDIAALLPTVDVLRQRCKALAVLDLIVGGDYYTYDTAWGDDEAGAMRNGSGEEFDVVFTPAGVFIRGVYHESSMFEHSGGKLWPGLLDGLPPEFGDQVTEPAFTRADGILDATFVLWRSAGDDAWRAGKDIDFSPADEDEVNPDGSWLLDVLGDDIAEKYQEYAEEVLEVELPLAAIRHVTTFQPLTGAVIRALGPDSDPARVRDLAEKLGFPAPAE
ncbi:hypothetical protein [Actinoplanes couchii]|uniref:hypothetical protein n=1 Tax=Actinoplanes couchii TaxID=403638 RepID=UPI0019407860|nr:hypothetical protein [Actinoplanes couchii]